MDAEITDIEDYEDSSSMASEGYSEDYEEKPFSFNYRGKDYSEEDIQALVEAGYNDSRWKSSNQKHSEEIKTAREKLDRDKATIENRRAELAKKENELKAYGQTLDRASEADKKEWQSRLQIAIAEHVRDYGSEFNYDELSQFSQGFNEKDPHDRVHLYFLAHRGSKLDELIQEARANVVRESKTKKGLPGVSGPALPYLDDGVIKDKEDLKQRIRRSFQR